MFRTIARRLRGVALPLAAAALAGCAGSLPVVEHPSPNQDDRVRFLVMHFTDGNFRRSLDVLTNARSSAPVSAHYLLSAPGEPAAAPQVYRLVDESRRAWHAGVSRWQGRSALNDTSIGIEIVYAPSCQPRQPAVPRADDSPAVPEDSTPECVYPDYPPAQIELLIRLAREVLSRHPQIDATGVVGHSDIAPDRKSDPGPRFPWRALADAGIGAWYDDADVARFNALLQTQPASLPLLQDALAAYGYGIEVSGVLDQPTRDALFAFRTHFLPGQVGAEPDSGSTAVALALLSRYRPAALKAIASKYGIDVGG